jgi:hypothetical protein
MDGFLDTIKYHAVNTEFSWGLALEPSEHVGY